MKVPQEPSNEPSNGMASGIPAGMTPARVPLNLPAPLAAGRPPPSRIRLDSNLRRWFTRNLGLWRSRRIYFCADDAVLRVDLILKVESFSEPIEAEEAYRFSWWPEKEYDFFERKPGYLRKGTMEAHLCGHQLRRSRGYHEGSPTRSQIRQVDEHELIFESHDEGRRTLEHIRLVDQDRYRSSSIYSWCNGVLELAELHHEERLEGAGEPLVELL